MNSGLVQAAYIVSTILFILALGGLSNQETARRGNYYGIAGMAIALVATIIGIVSDNYFLLVIALGAGAAIGVRLAKQVQMTRMPELVAILHSLVGLAAVFVGYATFLDHGSGYFGVELTIHNVEIYLGILIGALTFSGSVIAFGKLSGKLSGSPVLLPARHWLNLGLGVIAFWLGSVFVAQAANGGGFFPLFLMTLVALAFGVHMVAAIGGADMPVVVSMLNSYSGWAAAAIGFSLGNDLLIVVGALVGSSGAILS
ncbi:MAG: NAD(P)(+) transhydrogenase (Re/Si-specific) subunit beta, partial [Pseudomonadota bacterium]